MTARVSGEREAEANASVVYLRGGLAGSPAAAARPGCKIDDADAEPVRASPRSRA